MISLGLPSDPSEVEVIGKLAIRHGQLDQSLKLTIRSIRGISVEQALAETKRKSVGQLHALIEQHARDRFGEAPVLSRIRELIRVSRQAAAQRNLVLDDLWAAELESVPHCARKGKSRTSPDVVKLEAVAENLFSVVKHLEHERHRGCLHDITQASTTLGD